MARLSYFAVLCVIGLFAGCGPVAAPPAQKVAAAPPSPPLAPQPLPEAAPPPKPAIPPELVAKVEELNRLAEELKAGQPQAFNLDDLEGLEAQVAELAERQARLSTLAQEILAAHATLTPEQRAELESEHLSESLRSLLGPQPAVGPPPVSPALPGTHLDESRG